MLGLTIKRAPIKHSRRAQKVAGAVHLAKQPLTARQISRTSHVWGVQGVLDKLVQAGALATFTGEIVNNNTGKRTVDTFYQTAGAPTLGLR